MIDVDAVKAEAEVDTSDDALVLAVAKVLAADPAEVRKKRDADPTWFADMVAKYGLDRREDARRECRREGLMPTWTTPGTYTWVVPAGITELTGLDLAGGEGCGRGVT